MKLLDRYIFRQFASTFVLLLLALPFLFLITDLTDQLDNYLARNIPPGAVALSYLYYIPQLVFWGFPIAALIATVFTIGNMTRHQEITAAKAGGVSFYRLALPIILFSVLLSAAAVALGELVPVANQRRAESLRERDRGTTPFRTNVVFRTEDGRTLAAHRISAIDNDMSQVVIEKLLPDGTRSQIAAMAANYVPDEGWTFVEGHHRLIPEEGDPSTSSFTTLQVDDFRERPEDLLVIAKEPEEMRYAELERFIRTIDRTGGDSNMYRVSLAQKISLPLAVFVIVLFGAPLATSSKRGGAAFGVGISLIVTLLYLMMFKVGAAVGESGSLDPLVAAWAPNVLFLLGAMILLWRVRT
jgi:lipopolysaccharide export system permease protein